MFEYGLNSVEKKKISKETLKDKPKKIGNVKQLMRNMCHSSPCQRCVIDIQMNSGIKIPINAFLSDVVILRKSLKNYCIIINHTKIMTDDDFFFHNRKVISLISAGL